MTATALQFDFDAPERRPHAIDPESGNHVHRSEDELVGDQDPRHPFAAQARALRELRQVDDVKRPRRAEEELHYRDIGREPHCSALIPAALISGHHLSISAFW